MNSSIELGFPDFTILSKVGQPKLVYVVFTLFIQVSTFQTDQFFLAMLISQTGLIKVFPLKGSLKPDLPDILRNPLLSSIV